MLTINEEEMTYYFSQSTTGCFFMLLDEPIQWDDTVDKDRVLDYVFDHQRITRVNKAMLDQYGVSEEDFLGSTPKKLYAHDVAYGRRIWRDFFDHGHLHIETNERKHDGTSMWILGDYISLFDQQGRITGHFGIQIDITERKLADERINAAVTNWNKTFDAIQDGIALLNQDQHILQSNLAFRSFTGKTAEELKEKRCFHFVHGTDCPMDGCPYVVMQKSRKRETMEMKINGKVCEILVDPILDEAGNITGAVHIIKDISAQKKIIRELKASEEKFRSIFEKSPIGIEVYDAEGVQLSINQASCSIFGIENPGEIGFNLYDGTSLSEELKQKLRLYQPVSYQATFDFQKIKDLKQFQTTKTGRAELEYLITPLNAGETDDFQGYLLQVQDITERKKGELIQRVLYNISNAVVTTRDVEELIGIIREELGALVDTSNFYVAFYDEGSGLLSSAYSQDSQDDLTTWPAAKSLTGYVVMENKPFLATPDVMREMLKSGRIEVVGTPAACWLGVPLHMDGKVIGAYVVQSYDNPHAYTEEDKLVLEFVSDQISLSIKRKQTEHDLISAKEKAQESDRLKSSFLANMSHEIRTPMNAIVGFSGMLSDPDLTPEERQRFASIVQSRSDDLMHMVNDLLEISRIESGNAIIVCDSFSLNGLLDEVLLEFNQKLHKLKKTSLQLLLEKGWPDSRSVIQSDSYIVKQVFSNLIDNAIKYTPSGSIRFGYDIPENGMIKCFVKDTGIGISRKNQEIIFEHFRQADIANLHAYGGTGLGLSICKGSVNLLGGDIRVESEPGEGSLFVFTIPLNHNSTEMASKIEANTEKKVGANHWAGKRILLVEDDATNLEYIRILLRPSEVELVTASTGAELRTFFNSLDTIDVVLLDIRLPDANGWDLVKELKSRRNTLPVIAQTAYAMSVDRQKSVETGFDDYISKPIYKAKLLEMLTKFLGNGR